MEKKVKEAEDKSKKTDRTLKENKDRINDLEKEVIIFQIKNNLTVTMLKIKLTCQIEDEKSKVRLNEASQKELSLSWAKEREELKKQMNDMRSKAEELESAINAKEKKIKELVRLHFLPYITFPITTQSQLTTC